MPMLAQRVHSYYGTISSPTTDSCRNLVQNFERVCRKKTQTIPCYEDSEQRKRKVRKAKMLLMQRRKRKRERYGLPSGISESRKNGCSSTKHRKLSCVFFVLVILHINTETLHIKSASCKTES